MKPLAIDADLLNELSLEAFTKLLLAQEALIEVAPEREHFPQAETVPARKNQDL